MDQSEFHGHVVDVLFGQALRTKPYLPGVREVEENYFEVTVKVRFHQGCILPCVLMVEIDHPGWNPDAPEHLRCGQPLRAVALSKLRFEPALLALTADTYANDESEANAQGLDVPSKYRASDGLRDDKSTCCGHYLAVDNSCPACGRKDAHKRRDDAC